MVLLITAHYSGNSLFLELRKQLFSLMEESLYIGSIYGSLIQDNSDTLFPSLRIVVGLEELVKV